MFAPEDSQPVKPAKVKSSGILWVEATAFSLIIVLSWLTEAIRLPHLLYGENFQPNWHRAILRTIVIICIWFWVHDATRRLLKRLHYLEGFLRVCSWCRKVNNDGQWLEMEKFLSSKFSTKTSHGMCPNCLQKKVVEIAAREKEALPSVSMRQNPR